MGRDEFRLLHYAGEVNYNVNGEEVDRDTGNLEGAPMFESWVLSRAAILAEQHAYWPLCVLSHSQAFWTRTMISSSEIWKRSVCGTGEKSMTRTIHKHCSVAPFSLIWLCNIWWCLSLWLCLTQVMCMSENKILNQCFAREELTDKKRPETVRNICLSFMYQNVLTNDDVNRVMYGEISARCPHCEECPDS